jgi:hypothetical protein
VNHHHPSPKPFESDSNTTIVVMYPHLHTQDPLNLHSPFCLYEFACSNYFIAMESHSVSFVVYHLIKKERNYIMKCWWHTPVILTTQEAEIRRIELLGK